MSDHFFNYDPRFFAERNPEKANIVIRTVENYDHIMSKVKVASHAEQVALTKSVAMSVQDGANAIADADAIKAQTRAMSEVEIRAMISALKSELDTRTPAPHRYDVGDFDKALDRLRKSSFAAGYQGIQKAGEYQEVLRVESLDQTMSEIKFDAHSPAMPVSMTPPKTIILAGSQFSDVVEQNCKHDPNDTGFGFAYCKDCGAKMRRGPNLEWKVDRK
jgi:glucan biosynthesis protein